MTRRKKRHPRNRPLSDPARAPYARAALARKQRAAEREACSGKDAKRHAETLAHLRECLALLEDKSA